MPEFLPLCAFRQGLLPDDCRSCAWWLTAGASALHGPEAAERRLDWLAGVEHEWGYVGLLAHEPVPRRNGDGSTDPVVTASIQFAPASTLPRFREMPFPPLPAFSALLLCLKIDEEAPRWAAKRLIRRALYELRRRGIEEVFAVGAEGSMNGDAPPCRYFSRRLLSENGFAEVAVHGRVSLMRVNNRGLVSIVDQVEAALRRVFSREEEPAPSPAAWAVAEHHRTKETV